MKWDNIVSFFNNLPSGGTIIKTIIGFILAALAAVGINLGAVDGSSLTDPTVSDSTVVTTSNETTTQETTSEQAPSTIETSSLLVTSIAEEPEPDEGFSLPDA